VEVKTLSGPVLSWTGPIERTGGSGSVGPGLALFCNRGKKNEVGFPLSTVEVSSKATMLREAADLETLFIWYSYSIGLNILS
jgi:hypothetical protein